MYKSKYGSTLLLLLLMLLCPASASAQQPKGTWQKLPLATKVIDKATGKELITAGEGSQYVMALTYSASNPNIAFFGTDTSGIWKSEDGGKNWRPVFKGFTSHGSCSIMVDPVNANIVFAVGYLGYLGRKESEPYKQQIQGIFRSMDGGESWAMVHPTPFYRRPGKGTLFAVDSSSVKNGATQTLFAAGSDEGLLRSDNNGLSWKKMTLTGDRVGELHDIKQLGTGKGDLILAAANGLFKVSGNRAARIGKNLPSFPYTVAVTPANPNIVLTACGKDGIYQSSNGGATFTKATWAASAANGLRISSAVVSDVAISPVDANIAYARLDRIGKYGPFYSHDGGLTWKMPDNTNLDRSMQDENFYFSSPFAPHPQKADVALHVSNGHARIIRTEDAGKNWNYSGWGFTGALLESMAFQAKDSTYLALVDHGIRHTRDGKFFKSVPINRLHGAKSCGAIAVREKYILVALGAWNKKGIALSKDGGNTWAYNTGIETAKGTAFIHPKKAQYMFIGQGSSINGGAIWQPLGNNATGVLTLYASVEIKKSGEYKLLAMGNANGKAQLYESRDYGETWQKIGQPMPCGLQAVMRAAAVEEKIYVATSWLGVQVLDLTSYSGTWKTAGKMERDAIGQLHVEAVAVNPNNPQEVWAGRRSPGLGKGQGLLYSNDGGDNWVAVSVAGMPLFSIWSLAVSPFDETLYVGTWYGTFTFTPQKGLSGKTGK